MSHNREKFAKRAIYAVIAIIVVYILLKCSEHFRILWANFCADNVLNSRDEKADQLRDIRRLENKWTDEYNTGNKTNRKELVKLLKEKILVIRTSRMTDIQKFNLENECAQKIGRIESEEQ